MLKLLVFIGNMFQHFEGDLYSLGLYVAEGCVHSPLARESSITDPLPAPDPPEPSSYPPVNL